MSQLLIMQKLLSSNYNALFSKKKSSLYVNIPELDPFKRKSCIHLHLLNDF